MLISGAEHADFRQHGGVGAGAPDVLPPQFAVEPNGGIDVLHDHRGPTSKAPAPLHVGWFVHAVSVIGHEVDSQGMITDRRRVLVAAAGTLAASLRPRKLRAATLPPLAKGLQTISPPEPVPDVPFTDQNGVTHHLAEFKGHGMVVNMWATWCAPCVAEMPSLAALSKALAPQDIAVLPLSSDRGGAAVVQAWYAQHDITGLPVLLDTRGAMARAFNANGIPTTVIIGTNGKVVARLEGSADWASADAQTLVRKLVDT